MLVGTQEVGTHLSDPQRITRVGRILRKLKLDELPQVINIFKRQMNLVGPRPNLLSQTILTELRERAGVFSVKPGITGLAQVCGVDMSKPEKLAAIDATYVEHNSFALDLKIIFATFGIRRS